MFPLYYSEFSVFNYHQIPAGYYYQVMKTGAAAQRFWHREKFMAVARTIKDGSRVLDFGCGPGSFLDVLGENFPKLTAVGVDQATNQIEFASQNIAPKHGPDRIRFQALAESDPGLPFEDGAFDQVTIIEVVEHIHPYYTNAILREALRVLKPTGKLVVTSPNYRSLWPLIEKILEKLSPVKYHDQHINKLTPNSALKIVESAGFKVDSVKTIFIIAPFLSGISEKLARWFYALEKRFFPRLGSLLILEARPLFRAKS